MDNPGRAGIVEVMRYDADVLIVGGGLNGPALALALAQAGLPVTVIDAQPATARAEADFDGRAYALSLASRRMLEALGVWHRLGRDAQAINEIKISDGRAGEGPARFFLHFDRAEIDEGPMGFIVEDRYLRARLEALRGGAAGESPTDARTVVTGSSRGRRSR